MKNDEESLSFFPETFPGLSGAREVSSPESGLTYRQLLASLSTLTRALADPADFQGKYVEVIGKTMEVSRVYIFEHRAEAGVMDNTFEWTAPGVGAQKDNLQGVPAAAVPWWTTTLEQGGIIIFSDIEAIPDEGVKELLRPQGILSILVVPLFVRGKYFGFLGVDQCERNRSWSPGETTFLQAAAMILAAILDQRQTEGDLRRSEEKFSRAFHLSPAWMVISSLEDGRYLEVNEAYLKSMGFTRDEVIGRTSLELGVWEDPEERRLVVSQLKNRGSISGREVNFRKKSGQIFPILFSAELIEVEGERQMLSISLDITERKRAEEALRESEGRYRDLVEGSFDGILIQQGEQIIYANGRLLEMLGYLPEEILGMDHWLIFHPDFQELTRERGRARLAGEDVPASYEVTLRRKDGSDLEGEILARRIMGPGGPAIQVWVRDVTERRRAVANLARLEDEFRQAQKMEAIGRLAGGIAHDFNNILTVISGTAELVLMDTFKGDELMRQVEEIKRAASRAADLTRGLLSFSRRQTIEPRVLDLNEVLQGTAKMLRRVIGEDINLTMITGSDLGKVKADPGQIEQVLMNLAVNARDAMPGGGRLTIETGNVWLDEAYAGRHLDAAPGPYVHLSVTDTGTGMTKEVKERIFEPFFTTKEAGQGTGLGLSLVYGIVKQSGGKIWVYSEPGSGATFKIYLPRLDEQEQGFKEEVVPDLPPGTETVLVVEDEEQVRGLAARFLRDQGYRVLTASGGQEALVIAGKTARPIHLILTDVVMPGLSGPDLARRLTALHPGAKVLYMSGYTDDTIVRHGVLGAGIRFLEKPFTKGRLLSKVREALDETAASPPGGLQDG